jgi:hypothetical protein
MKVSIDRDDSYLFLLDKQCHYGKPAELTEEQIARIEAVEKEFEECQNIMRDAVYVNDPTYEKVKYE